MINDGIMINVNASVRNVMYVKKRNVWNLLHVVVKTDNSDYYQARNVWNPPTCSCENRQ